jgi:serine/threonine protein kinase, bacterial
MWDQDGIMGIPDKRGDLLTVRLTQACLDRAGLDDFHEGLLHKECMARPKK